MDRPSWIASSLWTLFVLFNSMCSGHIHWDQHHKAEKVGSGTMKLAEFLRSIRLGV
jgi:hypothetical protein